MRDNNKKLNLKQRNKAYREILLDYASSDHYYCCDCLMDFLRERNYYLPNGRQDLKDYFPEIKFFFKDEGGGFLKFGYEIEEKYYKTMGYIFFQLLIEMTQ